jgi:hypothetical protein
MNGNWGGQPFTGLSGGNTAYHAEINALSRLSELTETIGAQAEMWVTKNPCGGACMGSQFGGNIAKSFEQLGLSSLTIHAPSMRIELNPDYFLRITF